MIVTCEQMKALEAAAFQRGVDPEKLMESAGLAIADAIHDFFPTPGKVVVFCGKGNNAGDVLVAARHLAHRGWEITLDLAFPEAEFSSLAAKKCTELRAASSPSQPSIAALAPRPAFGSLSHQPTVVLDGLLGVGAHGSPREPVAAAIHRINDLRLHHGAFVVAADLPSGLDADTGEPGDPCVVADLTVTIGHAKAGLLADRAIPFVGRLALAHLDELATDAGDNAALITPELLRPLLPPRPFDSHKGTWGRVGIIAGSRGYLGAARLCSEAALRTGAGLVTLYTLPGDYELLATAVAPEIMVRPVTTFATALEDRLDALAIGPGLGANPPPDTLEIVTTFPGPAVVDADALNLLSRSPNAWPTLAGPRLFTPHPGEMARLFPETAPRTRRQTAEQYAARHGITLLLKGSRTVIAETGRPTLFNTTGNPGMGSGGMGDVLTGVTAAWMAQGRTPREAAMLGAWICGRAAECTVFAPGGSPESLVASDVLHRLGEAVRELRG